MTRILIVDDDGAFRSMMREVLEWSGYEVVDAPDGRAALEQHPKRPFDLIVTDLYMPEKEGIGTIVEIREFDPAVKIIAVSGGEFGHRPSSLVMARRLGANAVLPKPFHPRELLALIGKVLGDSKSQTLLQVSYLVPKR